VRWWIDRRRNDESTCSMNHRRRRDWARHLSDDDWEYKVDEFFTRWKKLCAELNVYKSLLLWFCFCIVTMLNSWTSLLIRNDSWILNNFLMLYCRICRKDCFIIKLFITVVDFAMRRLFICFRSSRVFLAFWLNISEFAQMLSHLSCYLHKRKDWLIFS